MDNGNGMTDVQKWRMGIERSLGVLETHHKNTATSIDEVKGAIKDLTATISSNHEQTKKRMELGSERMGRLSTRGWANTSLVFIIGCFIIWHLFDITVASMFGGAAAITGLILKVKQLL